MRCDAMQCNAMQGGAIRCNAMQCKQVSQQASKPASKQAIKQSSKQASTSRWVTGDPPAKQAVWLLTFGSTQASTSPYFDLQCNAMQCNAMQCNAMQCNAAMQCCDAMLEYIAVRRCWQCFGFLPNLWFPLWLGSHAGVIYIAQSEVTLKGS